MIVDVGKLRRRGVGYITCTCTACDRKCTHVYISLNDFEDDLYGVYCPCGCVVTSWVLDTAFDQHGDVMDVSYLKHTEIDGKDYIVACCRYCPFADGGDDGYGAFCNYPISEDLTEKDYIEIDYLGDDVREDCPLRDVME